MFARKFPGLLAGLCLVLLLTGCDVSLKQQNREATVLTTSPLLARPTPYNEREFRPILEFDPLNFVLPPRPVAYLPSAQLEDSTFANLDGDPAPEVVHTISYNNPGSSDRLLQIQVIKYFTATEVLSATATAEAAVQAYQGWVPVWPPALVELLTPEAEPSVTPTSNATALPTVTGTPPATATDTAFPDDEQPTATPLGTRTPTPPLTAAQLANFAAVGQVDPLPYEVQGLRLLGDQRATFGLRYRTQDGQHHLKMWAWDGQRTATPLKFAGQDQLASANQIALTDPLGDGRYAVVTTDAAGKLQNWRWDGQQFNIAR